MYISSDFLSRFWPRAYFCCAAAIKAPNIGRTAQSLEASGCDRRSHSFIPEPQTVSSYINCHYRQFKQNKALSRWKDEPKKGHAHRGSYLTIQQPLGSYSVSEGSRLMISPNKNRREVADVKFSIWFWACPSSKKLYLLPVSEEMQLVPTCWPEYHGRTWIWTWLTISKPHPYVAQIRHDLAAGNPGE